MYRYPSESEKHECTWLAFGMSTAIWGKQLLPLVQQNVADVALAIAQFEPVRILVTANNKDAAYQLMGHDVEYIEAPLNDIWIRDMGANFVINTQQQKLAAIDFNFNGWGNKQAHQFDRQVAKLMAELTDAELVKSTLTMEGGGIEVDGLGNAILTESCIINNNRNPSQTKQQIEQELKRCLGLNKIIWLQGIKERDITDGHVDFYARFLNENTIIASMDDDPDSFDYHVTRSHLATLQKHQQGNRSLEEIIILNAPQDIRVSRERYPDFAASYINYYHCNNGIIIPQFGDKIADNTAIEIFNDYFPDKEINAVNIDAIAIGGGIHCITQQQPILRFF